MATNILLAAIDIYTIVLIVRIVFSWLPPRHRANEFYQFIYAITEPVMRPFRRLIPPIRGFDLSPIAVFIILSIIERILRGAL